MAKKNQTGERELKKKTRNNFPVPGLLLIFHLASQHVGRPGGIVVTQQCPASVGFSLKDR